MATQDRVKPGAAYLPIIPDTISKKGASSPGNCIITGWIPWYRGPTDSSSSFLVAFQLGLTEVAISPSER